MTAATVEKTDLPTATKGAAQYLEPGDILYETWHRPARGHKAQSVDAHGPNGEKLHELGEVEQVVNRFDPGTQVIVILAKSRRRLRYETVAPVWVA